MTIRSNGALSTTVRHQLQVVTVKDVALRSGVQTLRLVLDRDGETGSVADIDCLVFKKE